MKRIAFVTMLCATPAWAEVGRVVQADDAIIIRGDKTIVAEEGTPVDQGDLLQTTPFGLIHVLMNDETKFVVGPGAAISIDTALIGASDNTFENLAVGMTAGLFRMITGNSKKEAYQVNTPVATMGVRGTAFDTCLTREFLLIVHEGIVHTCTRDPVTGQADPDSCMDVEAVENACPVITAVENDDGEPTIGPATGNAILQCRLSYEQVELGVLPDFQIDGRACQADAEAARQNTQPETAPLEEAPPEEAPPSEDETESKEPGTGEDGASGTQRGTAANLPRLMISGGGGGGGSGDACSKSELLDALEERADEYKELIEGLTDQAMTLAYEAALRTLSQIQRDLEGSSLDEDDCERLEALLTTHCAPPSSPATFDDRCMIGVLNSGF